MVISLLLTIGLIYFWIHGSSLLAVLIWCMVRVNWRTRNPMKEVAMLLIFSVVWRSHATVLLFSFLEHTTFRDWMLARALKTDPAGAMSALLFAYNKHWHPQYRQLLSEAGLMHVWVVSGYHLYSIRSVLHKYLPRSKQVRGVMEVILSLYVWVVCAGGIPLVRAWLARWLVGVSPWERILWVWYGLLLLYPEHSLHPSLILSIWASIWLQLRKRWRRGESEFLFSVDAWLAMLYPCLSYGMLVNPWGWCMDYLWTRWVIRIILPGMWFMWVVGPGRLGDAWGRFIVAWLAAVQSSFHWFPKKMIASDEGVLLLLCAMGMFVYFPKRSWMICVLWGVWNLCPKSTEHYLHMFDVGRGQSILWVHGPHAVLLDTGDFGASKKIARYLRDHNIVLDAIFISHHDQDHRGGLEALRGFLKHPGNVWLPEGSKVSKFPLRDQIYKNHVCLKGMVLPLGAYRWRVLHPDHHAYGGNDQSCVWQLEGPERWIFPGDISSKIELQLLKDGLSGPLDGLVASHHGSKSSNHVLWLALLKPKRFWISTHKNSWKKKALITERFPSTLTPDRWHVTGASGDAHLILQSVP